MNRTAIFRHPLFLAHDPGYDHVESPERLRVIYEEVDTVADRFLFPDFAAADEKLLALNHGKQLIARVKGSSGRPFTVFDPDTRASAQSWEAAALAAGAAARGVDLLVAGEIDNGFALVRPPGHHAEADHAMGFCLFNNIAVAARHALVNRGLERVFIFDWDLHHGNGTQHSFYDTDRVFYCSTHQYPHYPGSGAWPETGSGRGQGHTLNLPLPGGQDDAFFAGVCNDIVAPLIRAYRPQLLLVSAGYDIYHGDPLGSMRVTEAGFGYMARKLLDTAAEVCCGRVLFCLEGGYNLTGLRRGVRAVLDQMTGHGSSERAVTALAGSRAPEGILAQAQRLIPLLQNG
ncbi:MAG: histone deacetylase [Thermodesulfobacteriota bacterium]